MPMLVETASAYVSSLRLRQTKKGGHCWPPLIFFIANCYGQSSRKNIVGRDVVLVTNPLFAPGMVA